MRIKLETVILLLIALSYLLNLGQTGFGRTNDESLYVQIASEMHHRGDWTIPTWFGEEAYYKPPLLYWSIFPFFKIFGENLTAARIPSVLAAFLTLRFTFLLMKRLYGQDQAIFTVLLLSTCLSFARYAKIAMMEPLMMLSFVLNLYALYKAHRNDQGPWTFCWFVTCGASGLVKGPVSILILALTAILFSALTRKWDWLFRKSAIPGILVGSALILLWPGLIAWRGDWVSWWNSFILRENFGKFHNLFYYSPNNLWKRFLVHLIPWSLFFLGALFICFRKGRWKEHGALLNFCFLASFFGIFTLPAARLYHYSIAALPSGAMLIGAIYPQSKHEPVFRWASILTGIVAFAAGSILAASSFFFNLHGVGLLVFLAGLSIALTGLILLLDGNLIHAAGGMALAYVACALATGIWRFPFFPPEGKSIVAGSPLCVVRQSPYIWSYEVGERVVSVESGAECSAFLKRGGKALISQTLLENFSEDGLPPRTYKILLQWPAIRPNFDFHDFLEGARRKNKLMLEEKMYLIEEGVGSPSAE